MKLQRLKNQAELTLNQSQNQVQAAKDWVQDNSENEHIETIKPHIEVMEEKLLIVNEVVDTLLNQSCNWPLAHPLIKENEKGWTIGKRLMGTLTFAFLLYQILEDIKKLEFMQETLTDEDILYVEHALLNTLGSPLPSPSDDEEVFRQKSRATREELKVAICKFSALLQRFLHSRPKFTILSMHLHVMVLDTTLP